ncbi:MarR family winged helix-turn-helix transcriptional regulator [Phycicoccus flavus]|uniref:MarR family winged helix-turn-helix transcriptional regulator n=1 Tax=Phycicoccus flavus TaxID=2502783 RepID=UPI000FEBC070|nr:MarR family winged helix-turn-helix transcriptional regulator [Phycicoccus flavus]NHA68107.1 winged helix-turn-helix transcriptional regulator [Phycicoccus flavus]
MARQGWRADGDGPGVGVLMFVAHRAMEQRILAAVHAAGFTDTTIAQGRVAARIRGDGVRLGELAESAQVTKQTASFLVDRLEENGYVERVVDPDDARARIVRMAARGRAVQEVAAREEAAIYREWAEHLGADELARLVETLHRLREVTDPYRHLDPDVPAER